MGYMKDLDIRIRQGGDDAIVAACELLPRWISVEERLPPHLEWVLVNHEAFGIEMAARHASGDWSLPWRPRSSGVGYTHWMPLPAPPEEAADEIERLSQKCDCPAAESAAKQDKVLTTHDAAPAARAHRNTAAGESDHVAGTGDTLTDAERATLQWYCDYCVGGEHADILRGLLERTKGGER